MRKLLLILLLASSAFAQKPIPFLTPYPGSRPQSPQVLEFDKYQLLTGPASKTSPKLQDISGRVTRVGLRGPNERSLREIFANYEEALRKGGFSTVFRCENDECGMGDTKEFGYFNPTKDWEGYYIAAKKNRPEGAVYIALGVKDKYSPYTTINVVEEKAMETGLVKVTALEMKNDLATSGHVALYNILFDTAKADIKSESAAAVAEVAKLLQANPGLKIYVVGHTDNAGTYDANVDLSKRRADAVVKELTAKHGVAAARMRAVGVGSVAPVAANANEEGRKLNRRVELVAQ
jgi:OOP family OmpA-OmpF porin